MIKKYLVIGNPIEHSLSPELHNFWIKKNNIKAIYDKKKISEDELKNIIFEVKKEKINLKKDFYVFTGSTVGVVPFKGKGLYKGTVDKIGSVSVNIR